MTTERTPDRYWELNGGRPTVEGMLAKLVERENALTGTLLARIDPEIAKLIVSLKAASQQARRYLSELSTCFENEKATSTYLEEINAGLVRQAILTVLDESNPRTPGLAWNFDDDEHRVDFADRVASFLPSARSERKEHDDPGSLKIMTALVERAYGIFTASGVLRVAEQDQNSNDPIVAWASDVRSILYRNKPAPIDSTLRAVEANRHSVQEGK